jgi:hypothetical protein
LSGSFFSLQFADAGQGATIIGHLNTQVRMQDHKLSPAPSDTFLEDRRRKYHNGEPVEIFPQQAVTDGDSIVHFRRSDVIVTGDIFTTTQYPFIDVKTGKPAGRDSVAQFHSIERSTSTMKKTATMIFRPGRITDEWDVADTATCWSHPRPRSSMRPAPLQQALRPDRQPTTTPIWRNERSVDNRHVR